VGSVSRHLARLDDQLAKLERLVLDEPAALDCRVPEVSGWSVRQQIDHMLKVMALGLLTIDKGSAKPLPRVNLLGRVLMRLDWIPRGRGKAPERVRPQESADPVLLAEIRRLRGSFADPAIAASPRFGDPTPIFPHPYFGGLSAEQGVCFLCMHTHHHWKIVRDIRKAARA
jgi:hypothetical protein